MNVTLVPSQMVAALDEILTPAVTVGFTVITTAFDVAGLPVAHPSLDVITQVIDCPVMSVLLVYVDPVPTFVVLIFH